MMGLPQGVWERHHLEGEKQLSASRSTAKCLSAVYNYSVMSVL